MTSCGDRVRLQWGSTLKVHAVSLHIVRAHGHICNAIGHSIVWSFSDSLFLLLGSLLAHLYCVDVACFYFHSLCLFFCLSLIYCSLLSIGLLSLTDRTLTVAAIKSKLMFVAGDAARVLFADGQNTCEMGIVWNGWKYETRLASPNNNRASIACEILWRY